MLDFTRSFLTWTRPHRQRHPYYKRHGGFVGQLGDVYRVRMQVEATMDVVDPSNDVRVRHFLIYRCRTELTIATDQFFMLPSGEWCEVFGRDHSVPIARLPSDVSEPGGRTPWNERFSDLAFRPVVALRLPPPASVIYPQERFHDAHIAKALLPERETIQGAEPLMKGNERSKIDHRRR